MDNLYYVTYMDNLCKETGFRNKDGIHELYTANGGQMYFRRVEPDGADGHLGFDNPCIKSIKPVY